VSKEGDKKDERKSPAASSSILASVKASLGLLTPEQRRRYWLLVLAQASLAFLDLGGVFLLGLVAYLATASLTNTDLPPLLTQVLEFFGLEDLSRGATIALVAVVAAVLLMGRTIFSLVIYRWMVRFLATCQASLSADLMQKTLNSSLLFLQGRSTAEMNYAIISGPGSVITGNLANAAQVITEISLFVVLIAGLVLVNPGVTVAMVAFLSLVAFGFHRVIGGLSFQVGQVSGHASITAFRNLQEALMAYREVSVANRKSAYASSLRADIQPLAAAQAKSQIINYLPAVLYQSALVIGILALVGWEFWRSGPSFAAANIAVFLAASARILPALQRTNGILASMRNSVGGAEPTYRLSEELAETRVTGARVNEVATKNHRISTKPVPEFHASINLRRVTFKYPRTTSLALIEVDLACPAGTSTAVVGRTGAGKSTLVDLMLGMLEPDSGTVAIAGVSPKQAIETWPGGIGYVPQSVALFDSTVRENIALGLTPDSYDESLIWRALEIAHLSNFIDSQPAKLDTLIGERGVRLSGGQRQRLGLARALFTRPKLLVLDEATSSIDTETEHAITEALNSLAGDTTIVTIAHRLSTVRRADQVVYLEAGRVISIGAFEQVRLEVPQFERQAQLAGL
jgi:ABC-type multidrug transport system fused ATPase/permease subunit